MDFPSSLEYLYGLQRFGMKLGLENMQVLKERLPLLQEPFSCVHVAGTNGKGSVSVLLAEMLQHSGLRVGLYTSPHLRCFTERIRIDGVPIGQNEMVALAEVVRLVAGDIPITFFEATTAMALLAFKNHQVDIAVIETGLGGRLDATNIIEPKLCLITPISLDHSEHLGAELTDIAFEKAGIIKQGVPVVIGKQTPEVNEALLSVANDKGATVSLAGCDYRWQGDHDNFSVDTGSDLLDGLSCVLAGVHQLDNFAQAVAAAMQLREQGVVVTDAAMRLSGKSVVWPGRLEWWNEPRLLLDVSHNLAGISCLADYLVEQNVSRVHLVTGLSGERVPEEVLMPLAKLTTAVYAVPVLYGLSVPPTQVYSWARKLNLPAFVYDTAEEGLTSALKNARHDETVVVCGSLYLVAELRQELMEGKSFAAFAATEVFKPL